MQEPSQIYRVPLKSLKILKFKNISMYVKTKIISQISACNTGLYPILCFRTKNSQNSVNLNHFFEVKNLKDSVSKKATTKIKSRQPLKGTDHAR